MRDDLVSAISCFERAVEISPQMYEAWFYMGNAYRTQGFREKAESAYRQALTYKPDYAVASFALSGVKKFTAVDQDVVAMEALLEQPRLSWEDRVNLLFGLANAYEDMGEYDKAFAFMAEGNKLKRDSYHYSISVHEKLFAAIREVFNVEFFSQRSTYGSSSRMPIFVVGMPRSGTTLIEQILSCHSAVCGAGELDDLNGILFSSNSKLTAGSFPDQAGSLSEGDIKSLARKFLECLSACSAGKAYVVDKNPSNFVLIGMIRLMFPHARVVHCQRDAADTCLSIYKQYFTEYRGYAFDLVEMGRYYCLYQELMQHWDRVLPGFVFNLRYEDMVSNQELMTRQLLEFCGLPWEEACLDFHASGRQVKTASAEQVRQPLYRSSIQKWRHYERHLGPLLQELEKCRHAE
jgi:tetratricopeptide (TPR) repeat protein